MDRVRTLVAIYDWIARAHFALVVLGLGGIVVAVASVVLALPPLATVVGALGVVLLVAGLLGWQRVRRLQKTGPASQPPQEAAVGQGVALQSSRPTQRPSRWLPDASNLLSLNMTAADLDSCHERAVEAAKATFGDDAKAFFFELKLMPDLEVLFVGQSRYAGQNAFVHVAEGETFQDPPRWGSWFATGATPILYDFDYDPGPPRWQSDSSWAALVEKAWIRLRPFEGSIVLRDGWDRGWELETISSAGLGQMFYLRDGVLLAPEAAAPAPIPWPPHVLGAVGAKLTCRCGAEFATAPEFEEHLRSNGF